jgi:hypothetical protein
MITQGVIGMDASTKWSVRVTLGIVAFAIVLSAAGPAVAAEPCCVITSIDQFHWIVTAKEKSGSARSFTFSVDDKLINTLKVGNGIYANFKTREVSLDGKKSCCRILTGPTASSKPPANTSCPSGFYGPNCVPCSCSPEGTEKCSDGISGSGACICKPGYSGANCVTKN